MKLSATTRYMLESMIPYTEANLRLAFKPSSFFYELEKKSRIKERTLRSAFYRAEQRGLIVVEDGVPYLTDKAKKAVRIYKAKKLGRDVRLLVIFDIPEAQRYKRDRLRSLLRELSFSKVQQSVWVSKYDHRELLTAMIEEYDLKDVVIVYEAFRLSG